MEVIDEGPQVRRQRIHQQQVAAAAERVLQGLCDMRLPLSLAQADCVAIAGVIRQAVAGVTR